mgnify:CR=1 FL=1
MNTISTPRQSLRLRRGSAMPMVMMFFTVVGLVAVSAVGVTTTADSMAFRGVQKSQADRLAESGINTLYDKICREINENKTPGEELPPDALDTIFSGTSRNHGQYEAKVIKIDTDTVSPAPNHGEDSHQYTYTITLQGTGRAPNGVESVSRATFRIRKTTKWDTNSSAETTLVDFPGAINSNTLVEIRTDQGLRTYDASSQDKMAHIVANDGVSWVPSGNKSGYTNSNVLDVQGYIMVPDQPTTTPYDFTVGVSGLGNPNGSKNYRTAPPPVNGNLPYAVTENEVTRIGQRTHFPDWAQVDCTMKPNWLNATANNPSARKYTALRSGSLSADSRTGRKTIRTPAFISGDFMVEQGDTVQLMPGSTSDPSKNVLYVDGNVNNFGNLENLGVTIVVAQKYSDSPDSSYKLTAQNSPWDDDVEIYQNSELVALSETKDAIKISSDSSGRYGRVYAALGGITITGNLEINGVLAAGGTEPDGTAGEDWLPSRIRYPAPKGGGIYIWPEEHNSFVVHFVREARGVKMPQANSEGTWVYAEPVRADRLTSWVKLK